MKIAYFTNQYPAVSHTFIRREIAAIEAKGIEVARFSIREAKSGLVDPEDIAERRLTTVLIEDGIPRLAIVTLLTAMSRPVRFARALRMTLKMGARSDRGMLRNLGYLMTACTALRLFQKEECVHVHAHFGTNSTAVALLCRLLGGPPYSFTVHGPEEFDKPWSLCLKEKIEAAAFVVGVSHFGQSQLYRHCGHEHWPKVKIVRCGVDQSYLKGEVQAVPDTNILVCVGRLCEQKGQLLLVEAAARLISSGELLRLVLVGDGEMRVEIEALIAKHGLEPMVEITGWASGEVVRHHLEKCRAMVLPSFAEGLPVVLMEALALGRPVLSTYIAGIPELVEPGKCGWLVPAGSVDALAEAMREILHTPVEQLSQMGQLGRQRVAARHYAPVAVQPLVEALRESVELVSRAISGERTHEGPLHRKAGEGGQF